MNSIQLLLSDARNKKLSTGIVKMFIISGVMSILVRLKIF